MTAITASLVLIGIVAVVAILLPRPATRAKGVCIGLLTVAATITAYWGIWRFDFLRYDDPLYVNEQPMVAQGLSAKGVIWAFTTRTLSNYHPVTWLSHMLDCQLFGVNAGAHHAVNLLFHAANSILILVLLWRLTRRLWPAAFVAAGFALHPLHVESVAWIAERKDVLSTFLMLLTIAAYVWYTRNNSSWRYLVVFVMAGLAMLAKPMAVTLPLVLVLLDIWPLGRWIIPPAVGDEPPAPEPVKFTGLIQEKLPLLVISLLEGTLTIAAQHAASMRSFSDITPTVRVLNMLTGYGRYVSKMVWPSGLSAYYPYSTHFAPAAVTLSALLIAAMTFLAIRYLRRAPYIAVGWFWFLITLLPVIGLLQVGAQAIADRYMYLPMIGLLIIVAFVVADVVERAAKLRYVISPIAIAVLVALAWLTQRQMQYWENDIVLGTHAIDVTSPDNSFAHMLIGGGLLYRGEMERGIQEMELGDRLFPGAYTATLDAARQFQQSKQQQSPERPTDP